LSVTAETKEPNSPQSVSIAGGSLILIGLMLWFFTSGIKTELTNLRNEVHQFKQSLETQTTKIEEVRTRIEAIEASSK
jgi:hypothetical protein